MALEISAKRVLPFYIPVDAHWRDVECGSAGLQSEDSTEVTVSNPVWAFSRVTGICVGLFIAEISSKAPLFAQH